MDGLFNIYKEPGMTSHDVVAKMRKIMKTKTVGHTGTLDPNATGVLMVAVGRATKVIEFMENDDKIYKAELTLGLESDTEDIWGNILKENDLSKCDLSAKNIDSVVKSFVGKQIQIPPMYSALKINGRKLYELAREGKEIERKGREIEIFDIYDVDIKENKVTFAVHCSKGTYIRTLCKDIGKTLGCSAVMSKLERIKAGNFTCDTSVLLNNLKNNPEKYVINLETVIDRFPIINLDEEEASRYMNGVKITRKDSDDGKYRVYIDDKLYGLCIVNNGIISSYKKIV